MYYSSGNYEAFAHPRKPKDADKKSAYIILNLGVIENKNSRKWHSYAEFGCFVFCSCFKQIIVLFYFPFVDLMIDLIFAFFMISVSVLNPAFSCNASVISVLV